ncbi:MAG TPA: CBS domain-containing protein [Candidatus Nanoarchaeia archaeon]|nr:CBS domain-containing protein [Candidatus Nanoarchaeia archaeon]
MSVELADIRQIRKQVGITQAELAYRAQVSQSLIAKIEAGAIDPTYTNAQKIFRALQELQGRHDIQAAEIMQHKVIAVSPDASIPEAIRKMKKHEISQMPVLAKGNVQGIISESILLDALVQGKHEKKVREVMQDSPPIVPPATSAQVVSHLLQFFPIVLVADNGRLEGLISRADIVRKMYR